MHTVTFNNPSKLLNESFSKFNQFGDKVYYKQVDYENHTSDSSIYVRTYNESMQIKESSLQMGYTKEFFYNSKGQLERTISTSNGITTFLFYKYDSKGNETEFLWMQNGSKKIKKNTYNNDNNLVEFKEYFYEPSDTIGKLFLHKRITYTSNNKPEREEYLGGYFDIDKELIEYSYDKKGNLTTLKKGKDHYIYNDKGFLIKREVPIMGGLFNSTEMYDYSFRK